MTPGGATHCDNMHNWPNQHLFIYTYWAVAAQLQADFEYRYVQILNCFLIDASNVGFVYWHFWWQLVAKCCKPPVKLWHTWGSMNNPSKWLHHYTDYITFLNCLKRISLAKSALVIFSISKGFYRTSYSIQKRQDCTEAWPVLRVNSWFTLTSTVITVFPTHPLTYTQARIFTSLRHCVLTVTAAVYILVSSLAVCQPEWLLSSVSGTGMLTPRSASSIFSSIHPTILCGVLQKYP